MMAKKYPYDMETWSKKLLIARIKQAECEIAEWKKEAEMNQHLLVLERAAKAYTETDEFKNLRKK